VTIAVSGSTCLTLSPQQSEPARFDETRAAATVAEPGRLGRVTGSRQAQVGASRASPRHLTLAMAALDG